MPVALLLACALMLAACGGDEKEKPASTPAATETAEPAQEAGCEKVAKPQPANEAKLPKPTTELKAGKTYVARVLTNCGEFEITLDPKRAPKTGGSFASLVGKRFYDGLTFHRIVAGFVIQGGDPDGRRRRRPGLHGDRGAARRPDLHARASWRWPRPPPSRPARRAASSSS